MLATIKIYKILILPLLLAFASSAAFGGMTVVLTPSLLSPQLVGTTVVWAATVTPCCGTTVFRFSTKPAASSTWTIVRDYDLATTLPWTSLTEGTYNVQVEVLDTVSGLTAQAQMSVQFVSRVHSGGVPVVSRTSHPLVALYSAPVCSTGRVRVAFWPTSGGEPPATTAAQACNKSTTLNFFVAGMLPNTAYSVQQQQLQNSTVVSRGPILSFQTAAMPIQLPAFTISKPPDSNTSAEQILMTSFIGSGAYSLILATDLAGNPLWYYQDLYDTLDFSPFMTRITPQSSVLLMFQQGTNRRQVVREVDLAGNLLHETNASALSRQLTAMGRSSVNWLSHEALRLPNGHTLILAATERLLNNIQGPGNVDVIGEMILDLDQNFQVTWSWNPFDFLPTNRKAILGETCTITACGPLNLATIANDWTHCNSLFYMPNDGSLVVSLRNQDWVLKLNYQNGTGDGSIIWTLGRQGSFTINSSDTWPWFSHQHNVEYDGTNYELFDDGNTRVAQMGGGNSRGYVLSVDETNMTATPVLLKDLGAFSQWWGSAQHLTNGNYHFLNGCLGESGTTVKTGNCIFTAGPRSATSMEVQPDGTQNYTTTWNSSAYRSFRLKSLYSYVP